MTTLKQLAARRLGVDPNQLLGFRQLDLEVVVIAPDGRKFRFSMRELEGDKAAPEAKARPGGRATASGCPTIER